MLYRKYICKLYFKIVPKTVVKLLSVILIYGDYVEIFFQCKICHPMEMIMALKESGTVFNLSYLVEIEQKS